MRSTKKSDPLPSKIPIVKKLYETLGFRDLHSKDAKKFMSAIQSWRSTYQTKSGWHANELLEWKHPEVRVDLEEVATAFIDTEGNGERYWSASRSWAQDLDLKFPEDRVR